MNARSCKSIGMQGIPWPGGQGLGSQNSALMTSPTAAICVTLTRASWPEELLVFNLVLKFCPSGCQEDHCSTERWSLAAFTGLRDV